MKTYDRVFEKILVTSREQAAGYPEIFLIGKKTLEIRFFKGQLEHFAANEAAGVSIRLFRDGKEGFAYSEDLSDGALVDLVKRASEIAEFGPLKKGIVDEGKKISIRGMPSGLSIYNQKLHEVNLKDKIDLAKEIESKAMGADKKVKSVPYSGYIETELFIRIGTLEGLGRSYRRNAASIFCNPLVQKRSDRKEAFEVQVANQFEELNSELVAVKSVNDAVEKLGASEIASGQYTVIFDRKVMAEFLQAFSLAFSAKRVQDHQSVLSDKKGKKVANDSVRIVDDALYTNGYGTRPFDHEGIISKETPLIDNGVLIGLLHNRETAAKDDAELTGHAARSLKSDVGISPSNLLLEGGATPVEEFLGIDSKCIVVVELQGFHSGTDFVSGDFSLGAQGFLYKKGKRVKPLHNFTVSGNILDILSSEIVLANDFKLQPTMSEPAFGSPSVLVPSIIVSGK